MVTTDVQLYLAIGLPVFAFLLNIALGVFQTNSLQAGMNARFSSLEATTNARFNSLESNMNARFAIVDTHFTSLENRFDTLTGKVVEIDNRLTRVEERLLHP